MKIVFIGAGMAALVASEKLARAGFDVAVYEKSAYNALSYDWHDDVNRSAFVNFGLPMPNKYFVKRNWSFLPPSERVETTLTLPQDELDLSIERRLLAQQYADRAADAVDFHFGEMVDSLIIEDGVKGIIVGGKRIEADLVVDNSGALSPFRASLPCDACVTAMPDKDEIFVAYRGFHLKTEGSVDPENTNRAYLKHLGEKGISWSILDPDGSVNVLIGRVGKLTDEQFNSAYCALKASNPNISDVVVRGGIKCVIPIRYPLTRMVWDGYVAIGDSAFMTIPMIGSGIENSIRAAEILADAIINSGVKKQALWKYQVDYFLTRGAEHMGVDVLKRWLLDCKPADLDWLFEHGVIGKTEMAAGATGKLITLSLKDMLDKVKRGCGRLPLLIKLNSVLEKTKRAAALGRAIPRSYDEQKICRWQSKIADLFSDDK